MYIILVSVIMWTDEEGIIMLGDRVRLERERAGMTQEQLSAAAGLRQGHISRIENGEIRNVQGETLVRLARALNVTTDSLLGLSDESDVEPAGLAMVG